MRLANLDETNLDAVKLNWDCAADALSTLAQRRLGLGWRRLGEKVKLCFEIDSEGEQESLKLCQVLSDVDPKGRELFRIKNGGVSFQPGLSRFHIPSAVTRCTGGHE